MKSYSGYVIIESKGDLIGYDIIGSDGQSARVCDLGIIHNNGDFDNFPQFYKYSRPREYSCAEYWPVLRGEILEFIEKEIKYWEEKKAEFDKEFGWNSI